MRKTVTAAAFLVAAVISSVALAADMTGTIRAIDAAACTITIHKTVYKFAKACDFSKLKVGEKVTITYARAGNMLYATTIKPA